MPLNKAEMMLLEKMDTALEELLSAVQGDLASGSPGMQDNVRELMGELRSNRKEHRNFKRGFMAFGIYMIIDMSVTISNPESVELLLRVLRNIF